MLKIRNTTAFTWQGHWIDNQMLFREMHSSYYIGMKKWYMYATVPLYQEFINLLLTKIAPRKSPGPNYCTSVIEYVNSSGTGTFEWQYFCFTLISKAIAPSPRWPLNNTSNINGNLLRKSFCWSWLGYTPESPKHKHIMPESDQCSLPTPAEVHKCWNSVSSCDKLFLAVVFTELWWLFLKGPCQFSFSRGSELVGRA